LNGVWLVLRYLTLTAAGISAMLMSDRVTDEALYIFHFLLLLLALRLRDWLETREAFRAYPLPFLAETAVLAAAWQHGGLLPMAVPAALFTPPDRSAQLVPRMLAAGAAMNAAAWPHFTAGMLAAANLVFAVIALLLAHIRKTAVDRREMEALYAELQERHRELEEMRRTAIDYAARVQELAQTEERNRIAHDLHDELGHRLIRLKMMLEAAVRIGGENHGAAMHLVREVRDQLADVMEALRKTVRRLKPAEAARSGYSLETLIGELAASSGALVRFETAGEPYTLYPSDVIVLYRNAQEAVTNALRHGEATEVLVVLEYVPEELRMTVSNNGALPESREIRKGLGLLGMEERAHLAGGRVEVIVGERFAVRTILPRR